MRVLAVAAGTFHSLVLSEGKVYSFGFSMNGELGHWDTAGQRTPRVIEGLQGVQVRSIAAGDHTSLAVTSDGEAYGWGHGVGSDGMPNSVLGLELTDDLLVPRKEPGLRLRT